MVIYKENILLSLIKPLIKMVNYTILNNQSPLTLKVGSQNFLEIQ